MRHLSSIFQVFRPAALCLFFVFFKNEKIAAADGYFDFSGNAKEAYTQATSLRFGEARTVIARMKSSEPGNLTAVFIENYIDFFTVFLNQDEAEYKKLLKNADVRLAALAKGDAKSPYFLYCQAETRLQWAILRGKFGEYLTAINETKQAFAMLEANQKKFPDFVANKKSLGVMHALVGNVPDEYRWAVKLFGGMDGTIEKGMREIEEVIEYGKRNPDFIFTEESLIAYAFLLQHLNNQSDAAWTTLNSAALKPRENPLAAFALASLAIKTGRNDTAIKVLEECPDGAGFHPFHYKNFLLGVAKLQRLDPDANKPLEAFLNQFHGMFGIKEAYQKLAWYHLVAGNPSGYKTYIGYAKIKGTDRFDPDKTALREAKSGEIPDARLLKARLLFDGGYYQRAFDLLKNAASSYTGDPRLQLEYQYRMGRIAHRLGKSADAVSFYNRTVAEGSKQPWYFACNSALQLGMLYEEKKDWQNARAAYKRCLKINPDEYAASLHARAKAGLNRLKNK